MTCEITNGIPNALVRQELEDMTELTQISSINSLQEHTDDNRVFLNGILVGVVKNSKEFCKKFRRLRDSNKIDREVSIAYDDIDREIHIACDSGRVMRPLFSVKDNLLPTFDVNLSWYELVEREIIKYRDPAELENMVVAMTPDHLEREYEFDFCELHPSMMMGVCASIIPYPDHSQSPRCCYQAAMGKQALGIYALSNAIRADTSVHMLENAQIPIATTCIASFMGFDKLPAGQNVIVAILTYAGFNQEDSILMNKSAIQRGLFRVVSYKTVVHVEKKKGASYVEELKLPELDIRRKFYDYSKLGDDGVVKVGERIDAKDVLIGRVLTHGTRKGKTEKKDCSIVAKISETGIVDKVIVGTTSTGYKFVKVKIRSLRIPEVGDKFAARSAQKGTIGAIYSQEDLPFTADGMVPDIIMNPHAIPSRMTINQLIESLGSLLTVETGDRLTTTAFTTKSTDIVDKIRKSLVARGMNPNGTHQMFNGFTGDPIEAEVFMGPTYYQRLRHMVSAKLHSRSHGECQVLTRQPLEGRAREGGLRFGEMERDCMISHGAAAFLKERLLDMSDYFEVDICDNCHQISRAGQCPFCKHDQITRIQMPYACKLLFHELEAMCLKIDLLTT